MGSRKRRQATARARAGVRERTHPPHPPLPELAGRLSKLENADRPSRATITFSLSLARAARARKTKLNALNPYAPAPLDDWTSAYVVGTTHLDRRETRTFRVSDDPGDRTSLRQPAARANDLRLPADTTSRRTGCQAWRSGDRRPAHASRSQGGHRLGGSSLDAARLASAGTLEN